MHQLLYFHIILYHIQVLENGDNQYNYDNINIENSYEIHFYMGKVQSKLFISILNTKLNLREKKKKKKKKKNLKSVEK